MLKKFDATYSYEEPIILPVDGGQSRVRMIAVPQAEEANRVRLYPNPAMTYCIVSYEWENEFTVGLLEMYDATGKKVYTTNLTGKQDDHIIDTRDLKAGLYLTRIILDGKDWKTETLNIVK